VDATCKKVVLEFYIRSATHVTKLVTATFTQSPVFRQDSILGTISTRSAVADHRVKVFTVAGRSGLATSGHVDQTGLAFLKIQEKAQEQAAQFMFAVMPVIQIGQ
jgi:hypothetical protein